VRASRFVFRVGGWLDVRGVSLGGVEVVSRWVPFGFVGVPFGGEGCCWIPVGIWTRALFLPGVSRPLPGFLRRCHLAPRHVTRGAVAHVVGWVAAFGVPSCGETVDVVFEERVVRGLCGQLA
jgi:hypothetical protein